jgi:hypothetical protein
MIAITTVSDKIATLAERWKDAYYSKLEQRWVTALYGGIPTNTQNIYEEIVAAGPNASREKIVEIMGTDNWIKLQCDECQKSVDAVMVYYHNNDFNFILCKNCLSAGVKVLDKAISRQCEELKKK